MTKLTADQEKAVDEYVYTHGGFATYEQIASGLELPLGAVTVYAAEVQAAWDEADAEEMDRRHAEDMQ